MGGWLSKLRYIYTMECYLATKRNGHYLSPRRMVIPETNQEIKCCKM
jgi:hypothetical protein